MRTALQRETLAGTRRPPAPPAGHDHPRCGILASISAPSAMCARDWARPRGLADPEVGDGNLNLVFIVEGPAGSVCVKQALPYVRAPAFLAMSPERIFFERATSKQWLPTSGADTTIFHFDANATAWSWSDSRRISSCGTGLIAGRLYPTLAHDLGDYVARAAFYTSDLAWPFERKLQGMALFAPICPCCDHSRSGFRGSLP